MNTQDLIQTKWQFTDHSESPHDSDFQDQQRELISTYSTKQSPLAPLDYSDLKVFSSNLRYSYPVSKKLITEINKLIKKKITLCIVQSQINFAMKAIQDNFKYSWDKIRSKHIQTFFNSIKSITPTWKKELKGYIKLKETKNDNNNRSNS